METKLKLSIWTMFLTYGVINAFIYAWFFWGRFGIDILQFSSFNDLIPSIIYTITVPTFLFILIVSVMSVAEFLLLKIRPIFFIFAESHGIHKLYFLALDFLIIIAFSGLALYLFHHFYPGSEYFYILFKKSSLTSIMIKIICGALVVILGVIASAKKDFFPGIRKYRKLLFMILFSVPFASYGLADDQAELILNGINTHIITSEVDCGSNPKEKFRYIATVSDKIFALSLTNGSICIYKYSSLRLEPENKPEYVLLPASRL